MTSPYEENPMGKHRGGPDPLDVPIQGAEGDEGPKGPQGPKGPRGPRGEPPIPPTAQMAVIATLAITTILTVASLCYAAVIKGIDNAMLQISNLAVLVIGVLAGLVAGKHNEQPK